MGENEVTQEQLDAAAERLNAAREAHRANVDDEAAKAEYKDAQASLADLRAAHREQEIAAGRRPAAGTPSEGIATPEPTGISTETPSGA